MISLKKSKCWRFGHSLSEVLKKLRALLHSTVCTPYLCAMMSVQLPHQLSPGAITFIVHSSTSSCICPWTCSSRYNMLSLQYFKPQLIPGWNESLDEIDKTVKNIHTHFLGNEETATINCHFASEICEAGYGEYGMVQ